MTEKTRTVVVIESHQQTIIRRSRRTVSGQVLTAGAVPRPRGPQPDSPVGMGRLGRASSDAPLTDGALARPSGRAPSSDATERAVQEKRKSLGRWWLTVALKGVNVFSHWSRRLKRGGNERRNEQP